MKDIKQIAIEAAKAQPQSYYSEPFEPHPWAISAIIRGRNEGILYGREEIFSKLKDYLSEETLKEIKIKMSEKELSSINGF